MFYLFILESIGTSELLLIGLVALIVFGPRKLPEFARMLGKARNELRRTTNDFKQTWEREVDFENLENQGANEIGIVNNVSKNSIAKDNSSDNKVEDIPAPQIREVSQADFQNLLNEKPSSDAAAESERPEIDAADKRNWL